MSANEDTKAFFSDGQTPSKGGNRDIESLLVIGKTPLQVARGDVRVKSNIVLAEISKLMFIANSSFNQKDALSFVMMGELKEAYSRLGNAIIDLGMFHERLEEVRKNPEGVSAVSREAEIAMNIHKGAHITPPDNYRFGVEFKGEITPEMIEEAKAIIAKANAQAGNPDLGPAVVSLAIANAQVAANGESLGIDSKGLEEIIGESPFNNAPPPALVAENIENKSEFEHIAKLHRLTDEFGDNYNRKATDTSVVEDNAEGVPLTTELLKENILKDVPVAEQIDRDIKP